MNKAFCATSEQILKHLVVVVPAFNEEASLGGLLAEIRSALPQVLNSIRVSRARRASFSSA